MQHCCLSACFFVLDKGNKMLRWTDSDIKRHYKPVNPISRGNQSRTPYIWLQALNLICTSKLKKLKKFPCLSFFFFSFPKQLLAYPSNEAKLKQDFSSLRLFSVPVFSKARWRMRLGSQKHWNWLSFWKMFKDHQCS